MHPEFFATMSGPLQRHIYLIRTESVYFSHLFLIMSIKVFHQVFRCVWPEVPFKVTYM